MRHNQLRLLDLPNGAAVWAEVHIAPKPKVKPQYYLRVKGGDGWQFLWKTHSNGGAEWRHDFELTINGGNKKPLRYKTITGVKYAAKRFLYGDAIWEVATWKEELKK